MTEHFLVTGADGCVGAWTVRLLLDEGAEVTAFDVGANDSRHRLVAEGAPFNFRRVIGDITDRAEVVDTMAGADRVVHLAALQGPVLQGRSQRGRGGQRPGHGERVRGGCGARRLAGGLRLERRGVRTRRPLPRARARAGRAPHAGHPVRRLQGGQRADGRGVRGRPRAGHGGAAPLHRVRRGPRPGRDVESIQMA
ncbi:MAG: NAD-dependent epimerase/dehydratase family protein [Acidimicrobiaceae bacterium]|nr:NAD-dependent epimerase/dehydratase family protein [Acidimicrobiaceae bacterium]